MRRRVKRKRTVRRNNDYKVKAVSFVLIICFSVAAGYLTATYLIGPALGLEAESVSFDFLKKETEKDKVNKNGTEDEQDDTELVQDRLTVETEHGYALQYGSFSSKKGAKACVNELAGAGIDAEIIEKDGSYKVIGEVFDTRKEAEESKKKVSADKDVFITEIP